MVRLLSIAQRESNKRSLPAQTCCWLLPAANVWHRALTIHIFRRLKDHEGIIARIGFFVAAAFSRLRGVWAGVWHHLKPERGYLCTFSHSCALLVGVLATRCFTRPKKICARSYVLLAHRVRVHEPSAFKTADSDQNQLDSDCQFVVVERACSLDTRTC